MSSWSREMPSELARFFSEMAPFLRGESAPHALERQLGASPSGQARLGYYQTLMQRNLLVILGDIFPSVRTLVQRKSVDAWPTLVAAYGRAHPPRTWDPNGFGQHFASYLQELSDSDPEVPTYLAELADYQFTLFSCGVAPNDAPSPYEIVLFVRQYEHDLLDFVRRLRSDANAAPPEPRTTTIVIYREPHTATARAFRPSRVELLALIESKGSALDLDAAKVSRSELDAAGAKLRRRGVLQV